MDEGRPCVYCWMVVMEEALAGPGDTHLATVTAADVFPVAHVVP